MTGVTPWNNGIVLGLAAAALGFATWALETHVTQLAEAPRIVAVTDSRDDSSIEEDATFGQSDGQTARDFAPGPIDALELAITALNAGEKTEALEMLEQLAKQKSDDPRVHFHLARARSRNALRERAIEAYENALAIMPGYQAAAINLGLLLSDAKRYEEARAALAYAVEITSGRRKAKSLLALGKAEVALGAHLEAIVRFEEAIAHRPDYAPAWLWRGVALRFVPGRGPEIERSIRNALKLRPRYVDGWYELAKEQSRGERFDEAIESLEATLEFDHDHSLARAHLARLYHQIGRNVSARKQYRLLANAARGTPMESIYRGEVALLAMKFTDAIEHFNAARAAGEPFASRATDRLAEAHAGAGNHSRALELYDELLEKHPSDDALLYGRARTLLKLGQSEQAETTLRGAIAGNPGASHYWFGLGRLLSDLGRTEEAVAAYEESARLRPDSRSAHLNLAVLYSRSGHENKARAAYHSVLEFAPHYAAARFNLALLESRRGEDGAAALHYRTILERDPAHHKAALNLAVILRRRGETEEAEALLRDVVARKPGLYSPRFNLALLLRARGALDEAVTELRRVVALKKDFAKGWRSLGRALQTRGELHAAGQALIKGFELEPQAPEALLELASEASNAGLSAQAEHYYRVILRRHPEHEQAHEGLYLVLSDRKKREQDHAS